MNELATFAAPLGPLATARATLTEAEEGGELTSQLLEAAVALAAEVSARLEVEREARRVAENDLSQARAALAMANRLNGLGDLPASIVHEISNPLTALLASVEAAERWLGPPQHNPKQAVLSIRRGAQQARRIQAIVLGLRGVTLSPQCFAKPVAIPATIQEAIETMQSEACDAGRRGP